MEFLFVFFLLPIAVSIVSLISYSVLKKWFIAPILVFSVLTILTFVSFGETFLFWVIVFTILSIFISIRISKKDARNSVTF